MPKLNFKTLTPENWLEPDPTVSYFKKLSPDTGELEAINRNDWFTRFMQPTLSKKVPEDVVKLYEAARGAMTYGYLFYPLFTLGIAQITRVGECAIRTRCKVDNLPKSKTKKFELMIIALAEQHIIDSEQIMKWNLIRQFRNSSTHQTQQIIMMPQFALRLLKLVTNEINLLFDRQ